MNRTQPIDLFDHLSPGYRLDQRFGPVFDIPPAGSDDLTQIRGVDTREAVILNRLGVYQLAQVALWTDPEAQHFAAELGMRFSALLEEGWIEQARVLCRTAATVPQVRPQTHHASLPASLVRTLSLLSFAVLVGCLVVYWLNVQSDRPLRGVLSADITTITVPAESRLLATFVKPGDEVFTGDQLLTLEKSEHLQVIQVHQQRVEELERQLKRAEAQATLDLEWRLREVERELSDVRTRARLIEESERNARESQPTSTAAVVGEKLPAQATQKTAVVPGNIARQVSQSRVSAPRTRPQPNRFVFYGASGASNIDVPRPVANSAKPPAPERNPVLMVPTPQAQVVRTAEPIASNHLAAESEGLRLRLERLESLRTSLPEQVRRAAGVDSIRRQRDAAEQYLSEIQGASREVAVLCPAYGRIGQVRFQPGNEMRAGETMVKILHTDRRYIMLKIPTDRMNELQPGEVQLVFPDDQRFQGRIIDLPMLAEAFVNGQSHATVRIEPAGRLWPEIPIGSQIDVVIQ